MKYKLFLFFLLMLLSINLCLGGYDTPIMNSDNGTPLIYKQLKSNSFYFEDILARCYYLKNPINNNSEFYDEYSKICNQKGFVTINKLTIDNKNVNYNISDKIILRIKTGKLYRGTHTLNINGVNFKINYHPKMGHSFLIFLLTIIFGLILMFKRNIFLYFTFGIFLIISFIPFLKFPSCGLGFTMRMTTLILLYLVFLILFSLSFIFRKYKRISLSIKILNITFFIIYFFLRILMIISGGTCGDTISKFGANL